MTISPQFGQTRNSASYLCSMPWSPLRMTGFLVKHLQTQFTDGNNIGIDSLRENIWTGDSLTTKIVIEAVQRWNPKEAGMRPAILVRRNAWSAQQLGIGDILQGSVDSDGTTRYGIQMSGSHTIFCMSTESGECEELGFEVAQSLLEYGPVLRQDLQLLKFRLAEVGQVSRVLEAKEHFGVPISVAYSHNYRWSLRKHSPRIGSVDIAESVQ